MATETFTYDNLETGRLQCSQATRTVVSGQNLVRGQVVGKITSGGKYATWNTGASDGSEVPYAIMAEDADATSGDVTGLIYTLGEFNEDELTLTQALTDAYRDNLRSVGIYLQKAIRQ